MAFNLVPGMAPMEIPKMKSNGLQAQGMNILKAALAQQAKGAPAGVVGAAPMNVVPEGAIGQPGQPAPGGIPGMLGALMQKLKPQGMGGPIDPNTGLPVTQDVLAGAAALPEAGALPGQGIASPTAISDLW